MNKLEYFSKNLELIGSERIANLEKPEEEVYDVNPEFPFSHKDFKIQYADSETLEKALGRQFKNRLNQLAGLVGYYGGWCRNYTESKKADAGQGAVAALAPDGEAVLFGPDGMKDGLKNTPTGTPPTQDPTHTPISGRIRGEVDFEGMKDGLKNTDIPASPTQDPTHTPISGRIRGEVDFDDILTPTPLSHLESPRVPLHSNQSGFRGPFFSKNAGLDF